MNIKMTDGLKTTEAWAGAGAIALIAKLDDVVGIPESVVAEPELMTIIIVVKMLAIALIVACYTMGRSQVKAAEKSPAPLILGPETGDTQ